MKKLIVLALLFCLVLTSAGMAVTLSEANTSLANAAHDIDRMQAANFETSYVEELYENATKVFNASRYKDTITLSDKINVIATTAFTANNVLASVRIEIQKKAEYGYETQEAELIFAMAEEAFENGDFWEAEVLANQALAALSIARSNFTTKLIKSKWEILVILSIVLAVSFRFAWPLMQKSKQKMQLGRIKIEKLNLNNLMQDAQRKYYRMRIISKGTFDDLMKVYKEKYEALKKKEEQIKEALLKFEKKKRVSNL